MNARLRPGPLACAVVLGCAAVVCATSMRVHTGLDFFLPDSGAGQRDAAALAALSRSPLARRVVLSIEAPSEASAVAAWHAMAAGLADAPADLLSADVTEALGKTLFEHREAFISESPQRDVPELLSAAGVTGAVASLKRALASSLGPLLRATAPLDPLGFFERHAERMASMDGGQLRRTGGALLTMADGGHHAILLLAAHDSAFDNVAQGRLLGAIDAAFADVNREQGGELTMEIAAVARFSLAMERSIRADVGRISILSAVGITLLFLLLLGSPRYLLLGVLPLAAAFLTGTAACLLWQGRIHAMTFAFGAALVGVCIDYPIHLFNHHAGRSSAGDAGVTATTATSPTVVRALVLGCLTTAVGLSGMGLSALPGIREVALFGVVGVVTALLVSLWVLPPLMPRAVPPPRHRRASLAAQRAFSGLSAHRGRSLALVCIVALVAVAGATRLRFADDPRALMSVDPALEAEDTRVRQRAFGAEAAAGGWLAIARGKADRQTAMARNDALALVLQRARRDGLLGGYSSLHNLLWSAQLQQRNLAQVAAGLDVGVVEAALGRAGFVTAMFEPFFTRHAPGAFRGSPLLPGDLPARVRRGLIDPWFIEIDGVVAVVTRLHAVRDPEELQRRVAVVPATRIVNVAAIRTGAYSDFRQRTAMLAGLGLLAVLFVMAVAYRGAARTAAAFLPAALAAAGTVGALGLCGVALNLMHVVGLLLVLSMGADYGVFLVEHRAEGEAADAGGATHLALLMACTSTVLSFGLLWLSDVPALSSVGQSVAIGVVLALVLAPAVQGVVAQRA